MTRPAPRVLVTGGAGYVGAVLVPELLERGAHVRVLDLFIYGEEALAPVADHPRLELVRGDIRDESLVRRAVTDRNAVVHLACISNDPSFELDPELGRSVNFDAFEPLVFASVEAGVQRFVFASSSSVYGVSAAPEVGEGHPLAPLTDYSKYKAACEPLLLAHASPSFCPIVVRPATVCGYSPRMRFDLTVNILTNHAVNRRKITVFGGAQKRPNLHIADMAACYLALLELPSERVSGEIFNFGHQNLTVLEIAQLVRRVAERELPDRAPIAIEATESNDNRSYHVSSRRIRERLGLVPRRSIEQAVTDVVGALRSEKLPNALDDDRYYNVRRMQRIGRGLA
jgi:nucleoside-diphosphate-sugar epimerase